MGGLSISDLMSSMHGISALMFLLIPYFSENQTLNKLPHIINSRH